VCGQINETTKNGQWYEVKCAKPVRGGEVKLTTTQKNYLSISGIEVYSAKCTGSGCNGMPSGGMTRTTTSTSRSSPMPMMKMGGMGKLPTMTR